MRQIALDTETTGLVAQKGHRVIEIGCIELVDRRPTGQHFHHLLNPEREIDPDATKIHGYVLADLTGKLKFADIAEDLLMFLQGAELIIHNAPFDLAFLRTELKLSGLNPAWFDEHCKVIDTLAMAKRKYPPPNSLNALCDRFGIDRSPRAQYHGALIDAKLLAEVYLAMTSE